MYQAMSTADSAQRREAAMHDPEVREIMEDPAMQLILGQMQREPDALHVSSKGTGFLLIFNP